jgi:mannose-6-phosphate isomerase-like protein (cupin superfamily)
MIRVLVALLALGVPLASQESDAAHWSVGSLQEYTAKLGPKVDHNHMAVENLGEFGSHYVLVVHRDETGQAELHDTETDFYVVADGEATLHLGGEITDARAVGAGEYRGPSINGGRKVNLKPGDTVSIPPKVAHQILLEKSRRVT